MNGARPQSDGKQVHGQQQSGYIGGAKAHLKGGFCNLFSGLTPRRRGVCRFPKNFHALPGEGTAVPCGACDMERNAGFVNVGISGHTAEFAVESLRRCWRLDGRRHYPRARAWLIRADSGGSNTSRGRGCKYHLQQFADEFGLSVTVYHYPPGPASGTRSSIGLFISSALTGGASRRRATRRS